MKSKYKSKNNLTEIEELCYNEELDVNGICDAPITGNTIAEFSFVDNLISSNEPVRNELKLEEKNARLAETNIPTRSYPYGITHPVDGEYFDTRRSFSFRKSTVRKLNELKAAHPDINVYLNSIVDEAVCFYYDSVIKVKKV